MHTPVTVEIPVRYRDLDPFSHVNNAVYATYVEEARAAYFETVLEMPVEEHCFVTAALELSFRRPIHGDDVVTASAWTATVGDSSVTLSYELTVESAVVATAETTMVWVDMDSRESTPMPDDVRTAIVEHEGLA